MLRFSLVLALLLFPAIALAEEATPSIYSPDTCEFSVAFPQEPYITRECEDGAKTRCFDQISYTQVYDLSSTVTFRVICNPIDEQVFKAYTPEVMEATLRAMTRKSVVTELDASFREEETFKQAGLVGEGLSGRTPTIYVGQLWIGKKSALSVEAELIGEAYEDADTLFSTVLRSVGPKVFKAAAEDKADTEEKKEQTSEKEPSQEE